MQVELEALPGARGSGTLTRAHRRRGREGRDHVDLSAYSGRAVSP